MATARQGAAGQFGMGWRVAGNHHTIESVSSQKIIDAAAVCSEFRGEGIGTICVPISNRCKAAERRQISRQVPAPHAAADQSYACHRHLLKKAT